MMNATQLVNVLLRGPTDEVGIFYFTLGFPCLTSEQVRWKSRPDVRKHQNLSQSHLQVVQKLEVVGMEQQERERAITFSMNACPSSLTPLLRSSQHTRRERPCDRCHIVKEKCRWPAAHADECERCLRLKFECRSNRPIARAGRKARLAAGNRLSLRRWQPASYGPEQCELSSLPGDALSTASFLSELSPPTCQIVRSSAHREELDVPCSIALFPELSVLELHLLEIILLKQIDVDKYLIGPSFRDQHRQAFVNCLNAAMPLLRDAFIACAPLLLRHQDLQQLAKYQYIGYKRAAAAIASVRLLEVRHDHDLSMVLMLGVALVTFAAHHSGGELLLCRHILGLVKSRCHDDYSLTQQLGSDGVSFLICLLGTETIDCLIQCEVPTMKIRQGNLDELVDRFIGVSAPLLTHFYDLCEVARLIHHSCCRHGNVLVGGAVERTLNKIEEAVTSWQPSVPADFLAGRYTPTEVILMLAQAKVLRLSALLVLHRLRYAFGTEEGKALAMANAILDELDLIIRLTGQSFPFVDLPYLISCLEIRKAFERRAVLEKSHLIVNISPRFRDQIETWIVSVWAARDNESSCPFYWDDLGRYLGGI